jgi:molybdopterin synthase catalytic subunit
MHRSNAFKACEFVIDFLKTDAPFWKKEISEDKESWVVERREDIIKKTNWNKKD